MKRIILGLAALGALGAAVAIAASPQPDGEAAPIYGIKIPDGYRDWQLISVAREDGNFNQLRAQLGNDTANQGVPGREAAVSGRFNYRSAALG